MQQRREIVEDNTETKNKPGKWHGFNIRARGSGPDQWYSPDRDIANLFPLLVREMWGLFDDNAIYAQWADSMGVTSTELSAGVAATAKFVSYAKSMRDYEACLERSGFNDLSLTTRVLIMAALGHTIMRIWHERLVELNVQARAAVTAMPTVTPPTETGDEH